MSPHLLAVTFKSSHIESVRYMRSVRAIQTGVCLLELLLRRSRQEFCWQITVGSSKMKCQRYCKILCQIPCLDLREQAAKERSGEGVQCICSYSHHCSCRRPFTVIPCFLRMWAQKKLTMPCSTITTQRHKESMQKKFTKSLLSPRLIYSLTVLPVMWSRSASFD